MARTPPGSPFRAPTTLILSAVVFCGLLFAPAPTAAQDSWMLVQKDERTRRGGAAPPDGTGIREGDRPLEPRGGRLP